MSGPASARRRLGSRPGAPPDAPTRRGFFHWPCFGKRQYHGFPSGHAATAFAAAAALAGWAPAGRRGWILAAASGVGASRIVLNAHFLSDVLGGALFGWWAGNAGVWLVARYLAPRWRRARRGGRPPPGGRVTRRCLVVHPGALGDVLLAGPALVHLRLLGFHTTLAVASRLAALLRGSGLVDDARDLESLGLHRLFVEGVDPGALESIRSFDVVVCWLGAGDPTFRANLARLGRPAVIARAAPPPDAGRHASRHLVDTLAPLGLAPSGLPPVRLDVTSAGRATAGAWLAARGIGLGEAVVLQPGAGSAVKAWPGFAALARRLRGADLPVVVLAGPADGAVVETLLESGAVAEESLARDWPLPEIAALLSLARGAVGNDSARPISRRPSDVRPWRSSGRPIRWSGRRSGPTCPWWRGAPARRGPTWTG